MEASWIPSAVTGLVGIAGIVSTYFGGRAQQAREDRRREAERDEAQKLARYAERKDLYVSFLETLRLLAFRLTLWNGYEARFASTTVADFVKDTGVELTPEQREHFQHRLALRRDHNEPFVDIDVDAMLVELVGMEARISAVATSAMADAASAAAGRGQALLLRYRNASQSEKWRPIEKEKLEQFHEAVEWVSLALVYELRLLPSGETRSLEQFVRDAASRKGAR